MHEKILCNNFVEATIEMKKQVYFYVEASLRKSQLPRCIFAIANSTYSSFALSISPPAC